MIYALFHPKSLAASDSSCASLRVPEIMSFSTVIRFILRLVVLFVHLDFSIEGTMVNSATIVTFVVDENAPIGHEVGRIQLKDPSPILIDQATTTPLTFTLQDTSYFDFDSSDPSRLVVRSSLDRDADRKLCTESGWPEVCSWSGVIFASDGRLLSLRVVVRDANDNVPRWPTRQHGDAPAQLQVSVTENCPLGTMVDLPLASDPDIGENSIVRYELIKPPGVTVLGVPFEISSTTVQSRAIYRLVVKGPLDRETQAIYHLTVAAIDGGGNQGLAQLAVHVTDENDNKPIFKHLRGSGNLSLISDEQRPFVITVDEDVPVGGRLAQHPVATDADEGDFGRVTYAFALSTPDTVKRDFNINPDTGILSVRSPLDCDTGGLTQYQFDVIAQDQGAPPLTASARVIVNVQDKNDNAPIITVTSAIPTALGPTDTTSALTTDASHQDAHLEGLGTVDKRHPLRLVENSPEGKLIATITVHDPDANENGKFTCVLGKSNELRLNYLKQLGKLSVYQLISASPVDRESQSELRVTLRCRDHGTPSQSNSELLTVYILDVNDNPPQFSSKRYSFQTSEGNDVGQTIGRLKATDPDAGVNAQLSFTINWPPGQGPNPFSINSNGELRARVPLDRESRPEGYQFTVVVRDGGIPVYSSSAKVEVALIDINDCSPAFTQQTYEFTVDEELPQNATNARVVGQVRATDCDIGNNALLTYHLKPDDAPFKISPDGYITTTAPIDREIHAAFKLIVIAVDSPQSPERQLSSTAEIHVLINDKNDHDPVFFRPPFKNGTNEVDLSIHEKPGHVIARLEATDEDIGDNALIQFLLVDNQLTDSIKLHSKTGDLVLQRPLTKRDQGRVKFIVMAVDNGAIARTATATIHVLIKDIPATSRPEYNSGRLSSSTGVTQADDLFSAAAAALFGNGHGIGANKFIILCIVLITVVICSILVAVIFFVSRGGCPNYWSRSKLLVPDVKDVQFGDHMTDGTANLTGPKIAPYPNHCQLGSQSNPREMNGYLIGSDRMQADNYGLTQPLYPNYAQGGLYDLENQSHDVMIKNHVGYAGPNYPDLEDGEIMSVTGYPNSIDPYPVSPTRVRPYPVTYNQQFNSNNINNNHNTSNNTSVTDSIHYRSTFSKYPGTQTPVSLEPAFPCSTESERMPYSGGHTFSRFELRNLQNTSTGFASDQMRTRSHTPDRSNRPDHYFHGQPFTQCFPTSLNSYSASRDSGQTP